jgi:hypothetical protein|uniref:EF-hand domain-containing protein n=1 Tax=Phaeodactylum tricornutum TaxID=2850 RepID=A0A8J9SBP6_PHATR
MALLARATSLITGLTLIMLFQELYSYTVSPQPFLHSKTETALSYTHPNRYRSRRHLIENKMFSTSNENEETPNDADEDGDHENDSYMVNASSEFLDDTSASSGNMVKSESSPAKTLDWGGALGKLRQRVEDMESGKAGDASQVLFRLMSSESPNQAIGSFVSSANPQVVQAMSGAVSSLLGGLSNPQMGADVLVKASGDKIGSLCFHLQMTGYMFRNAEYVMALKEVMHLRGSTSLQDYKDAFDRIDADNSGFIEYSEIKELLDDVYEGSTPAYEVESFIKFFDENNDGKVSWEEFERGLGSAIAQQQQLVKKLNLLAPAALDDDDDAPNLDPDVTGIVELELENGKIVEVEAKEYIQSLKKEAQALKDALRRENFGGAPPNPRAGNGSDLSANEPGEGFGGITGYIASRQGDLKALTQGISPEIVSTMKKLVDFVLEGGESGQTKNVPKEEIHMEIPGSALQQLALWQLILGYRLREAEAKGDYLKLLE